LFNPYGGTQFLQQAGNEARKLAGDDRFTLQQVVPLSAFDGWHSGRFWPRSSAFCPVSSGICPRSCGIVRDRPHCDNLGKIVPPFPKRLGTAGQKIPFFIRRQFGVGSFITAFLLPWSGFRFSCIFRPLRRMNSLRTSGIHSVCLKNADQRNKFRWYGGLPSGVDEAPPGECGGRLPLPAAKPNYQRTSDRATTLFGKSIHTYSQ
jgi:hypothetical protein